MKEKFVLFKANVVIHTYAKNYTGMPGEACIYPGKLPAGNAQWG
jgi:hypothetical protein